MRLPLAILGAAVAAGVATLLLRPRDGLIDPVAVNAKSYFTAFQLERAQDFRELQRWIGVGSLVVGGVTLALLAARPPRALERLGRRPLLGGAAAGAGIAVLIALVELPLSAWAHERAKDVGLSTQDWGPWLADVAKSTGINAIFAGIGGLLALTLVRRFRRRWWIPASGLIVVFGVVTIWLFPVVIDPLFNDFKKLPQGQARADVLELAEKAGVDVGEVYRVDASRRTTAANAYVIGLGHSKRVVLYDNLLDGFPRDEVRSVVAHELGHQKHDDLLRGLAWLALVAPAGAFCAQALAEAFGRRQGLGDPSRKAGPAALPAIALAVTLVSFALGVASNVLSRQVEARADAYSIELTRDPEAHISLERRLALRNLSDPDPPSLFRVLFGTHPSTLERIGMGEAYEQGKR
jgi:STE24 endopeptidase